MKRKYWVDLLWNVLVLKVENVERHVPNYVSQVQPNY